MAVVRARQRPTRNPSVTYATGLRVRVMPSWALWQGCRANKGCRHWSVARRSERSERRAPQRDRSVLLLSPSKDSRSEGGDGRHAVTCLQAPPDVSQEFLAHVGFSGRSRPLAASASADSRAGSAQTSQNRRELACPKQGSQSRELSAAAGQPSERSRTIARAQMVAL